MEETTKQGRSNRDRHRRHRDEHRRERGREDEDRLKERPRKDRKRSHSPHRAREDREERDTHKRRRDSLPHAARHLKLSDRAMFEPLLAHYLATERDIVLKGLSDSEKESRWKRFVDRWNHCGLDDAWYEPRLFLRLAQGPKVEEEEKKEDDEQEDSDDSDDYGPALPPDAVSHEKKSKKAGATLPTMDDLRERRELVEDDARAARSAGRAAIRLERKAERKTERDRLDELVPRAAAGTRERQLEKKRALNDTMRSFRNKSPGAAEVDDSELMGDGSGKSELQEYKKQLAATQKKKTEWEVRREEEARARQAELDERREQYRAREAETIEMLRALARQRFG